MELSLMNLFTPDPVTIDCKTAMKITGIGQTFLYDLLSSGVVRSYKIGKRRLIDHASLVEYITSQPTGKLTPQNY
jgi:excisionase family DNA binding protein